MFEGYIVKRRPVFDEDITIITPGSPGSPGSPGTLAVRVDENGNVLVDENGNVLTEIVGGVSPTPSTPPVVKDNGPRLIRWI